MQLHEVLESDIERCKKAIECGTYECLHDLCEILYPKYLGIVEGINHGVNMMPNNSQNLEIWLKNIQYIQEKLELFQGLQEEHMETEKYKRQQISVCNHNINSNEINVDILFADAREKIQNMSALTDPEIEEILSKIVAIEKIVQSGERKSKKWENAKEIIKWVADKGIDVGITLLPLLLQI